MSVESDDFRLLKALYDLCGRGLHGDVRLSDLTGFNQLGVNRAVELFGGPRGVASGNHNGMSSQVKWLLQHLDGGTRTVLQVEKLSAMPTMELQTLLSPPKSSSNGSATRLIVPSNIQVD